MSRLNQRHLDAVRPEHVSSKFVRTVFRVQPEAAGMRLDRFLQMELKRTSRSRSQKIIERSAFDVHGKQLRKNDRVSSEQWVILWREPWDETASDVELPILFEDDHVLAINKPPHIPVHPTARYYKSSVVKRLEEIFPKENLKLSHRLDRETSGVLLLAKTREADREIKRQFARERGCDEILKLYLAISIGIPKKKYFTIDSPLELDPDNRYKLKMRVSSPGMGLASITNCEVLETKSKHSTNLNYSMIQCTLKTGRQHQIRAHLSSIGYPIVGDKLYGPDEDLFARGADHELTEEDYILLQMERHALHAHTLELEHPILKTRLRIVAPIWKDMDEFWNAL